MFMSRLTKNYRRLNTESSYPTYTQVKKRRGSPKMRLIREQVQSEGEKEENY